MAKVLSIVYFGGMAISAVIAFIIDPTGIVGPWLIVAWVFPFGPVVTGVAALMYRAYYG